MSIPPTGQPAAWQGILPPESFELAQAQRSVLLGGNPEVDVSQRARAALAALREESGHRVWCDGTVVERHEDELWWWTFAGGRGNATLAAALDDVMDATGRPDNHRLRLRTGVDRADLRAAVEEIRARDLPEPAVVEDAVRELKFGEILPAELATQTLALRLADERAARAVSQHNLRWTESSSAGHHQRA